MKLIILNLKAQNMLNINHRLMLFQNFCRIKVKRMEIKLMYITKLFIIDYLLRENEKTLLKLSVFYNYFQKDDGGKLQTERSAY